MLLPLVLQISAVLLLTAVGCIYIYYVFSILVGNAPYLMRSNFLTLLTYCGQIGSVTPSLTNFLW